MTLTTSRTPPLRAAFSFVGREPLKAPWQDSRPLPPAPCTSVPCWRRSAAISTRARMAHAGWYASRISIRHAWFPVVPTPCCAPSKPLASSGTVKSSSRARGARRTPRRLRRSRMPGASSRAVARARISRVSMTRRRVIPGTCRSGPTKAGPTALRFRVQRHGLSTSTICYLGPQHFDLAPAATWSSSDATASRVTSWRWWSTMHSRV